LPFWVQRLRLPDDGSVSFTVVGGDGLPVEPVEQFLAHLTVAGRSPNTVEGYAHDLRDFLEWLAQHRRDFRDLGLEEIAGFFSWLRRPKPARAPGVFMLPNAPAAVENSTLARKRAALASFYRFHARHDPSVPPLLGELAGARPTGRYLPMLVHTRRQRPGPDDYSPIRIFAQRKLPKTLTDAEVRRLMDACAHLRDRFLVGLLNESGLRVGEALGLRHGDLELRRAQVRVLPREDNANGARVKGLKGRVVPVPPALFGLYADYMELEYGLLDCDYVFVNLFGDPRGAPMTRASVGSWVRRLRARTGIGHFTPHALRHTYATRLLRAGVPIEVVAELLGHAGVQTTAEIYSHLEVEDHRRVLVAAGVFGDRAAAR
jgi:integrase/recombinase XerD